MYYIYKEIYLDTLEKKYKTIIVMDNFPDILKPYVKRIKLNKLSEYKNNYNQVNCLYALKSFLDDYSFMEINELPNLIGFLLTNNYLIDYHINKLISKNLQNRNFIAMFYPRGET